MLRSGAASPASMGPIVGATPSEEAIGPEAFRAGAFGCLRGYRMAALSPANQRAACRP